jgi:choline dehydrogenase
MGRDRISAAGHWAAGRHGRNLLDHLGIVESGDREALAAWVMTAVSTFHHPVGTCAMGLDPALGAVTDSRGSVHGIDALTVADASIMPTIPAATTNLPTIMVAEHIARWLRAK